MFSTIRMQQLIEKRNIRSTLEIMEFFEVIFELRIFPQINESKTSLPLQNFDLEVFFVSTRKSEYVT